MLMLLTLAAAFAGWRVLRAGTQSLRNLPRRNDDMVFW
jgi:hypothetical protein